ncbi:hypothetical protein [Microbacterium sp. ZXX196]|uniref:hypothetical protein n=1 Tax=Microbacterium sp. ZXX196 TaxID=2609291 RepID=UPI0012B93C84|nr:hypothetical protein [Microbacterium sp. ZXX196]MTE22651.1 hypothetical protein [Microbacterium sp. ZXX196]
MAKSTPAGVERELESAMHGFRDRAASVKAAHRTAREGILADEMASDLAKQTRIDELSAQTRGKLDAIRKEQDERVRSIRDRLERELLGDQPSDANSVLLRRDAADRARRISGEGEALDVLRDAVRGGDESLAHAVGHRARHEGWVDTLDAYREAHPQSADSAVALAFVESATSGASYNLANGITYSAP